MRFRIARKAIATAIVAGAASADPGFSDLTQAAIRGEAEKVEAILLWGGNPNHEGRLGLTPLAAAMRSCSSTAHVVYVLLKGGADIETRSGVGATPLMLAWQTGREDLAELLLASGADPTARNMYGDTAEEYRLFFSGDLPESEFETLRYTSLGLVETGAGNSRRCDALDEAGD